MNPTLPAHLAPLAIADSHDRATWLRARSFGITATDAAHLCTPRSVASVVHRKRTPSNFSGNAYTDYGRQREPIIAAWMRVRYGIESNTRLFRAADNPRFLATPDGITPIGAQFALAEIKTSTKPISALPRTYLRQIWWQQFVLGADRTLLVWEQQRDFAPIAEEPIARWIKRDEGQIAKMINLATQVLEEFDRLGAPSAC